MYIRCRLFFINKFCLNYALGYLDYTILRAMFVHLHVYAFVHKTVSYSFHLEMRSLIKMRAKCNKKQSSTLNVYQ